MAQSLNGVGVDNIALPRMFSGPTPKAYVPVNQYPRWQSDGMNGKITVKCFTCGKKILRHRDKILRNKRNYCSRECTNKAKMRRVKTVCDQCDTEFEIKASLYERNERNFCSRNCWEEFHKAERILCQCQFCKIQFYRKKIKIMNEVFCSIECWQRGHNVELICQHCGETFYRQKGKIEQGIYKYCSHECAYKANKGKNHPAYNRIEIECHWCHKKFAVERNRAKNGRRKFCSRRCRYEANTGVGNPRWKGGYDSHYGPNWLSQRQKTLDRDGYICRSCGKFSPKRAPDVHHIIPFIEFGLDRYREANVLANLITLCRPCHSKQRE